VQPADSSLQERHLSLLVECARTFCSSLNIHDVLDRVLDKVIEVTGAERGFVVLTNREDGSFEVNVARNAEHGTIDKEDFKLSRKLMEKVAREGEPILTNNAVEDPRFSSFGSIAMHALRSIMCVPLQLKSQIIGVIFVDNRMSIGLFKDRDLEVLSAIGHLAAIAIDNAQQHESTKEVVIALAKAIEAKDAYTGGHVDRVTLLALAIGNEMRLDEDTMRGLEMAAILHDVGKIGIEEAVLCKPSMLNHDERRIMEKHPFIGEAIVRPLRNLPQEVKLSILHHQERWDGKGYPGALKGEQIPLYARIVAVSDTYDAMCSNRPYRKALPRQVAVDEINKNSGSQFDPTVVAAFTKVMEVWIDPPDV
jgi:GAF domain-containing protein